MSDKRIKREIMNYQRVKFQDGARVIVVAFDVCSSSDILEKLTVRGSVAPYFSFLTELKHFMADQQMAGLTFEPYKFTGDGWILLFPTDEMPAPGLTQFVCNLSHLARSEMNKLLEAVDSPPEITGINFGIDVGPIFHAKIYGQDEYVARPIVVACRLQGALKDIDPRPAYKALVTRDAFKHLAPATFMQVADVQTKLRNVGSGAPFHCKKVSLLPIA